MEEFYDEEVPPPTVITEKKSLVGGESGGRKNKGRSKKKGASSAGQRQQQPSAYKIEGIEDAFTKDQLRKQKRSLRSREKWQLRGAGPPANCHCGAPRNDSLKIATQKSWIFKIRAVRLLHCVLRPAGAKKGYTKSFQSKQGYSKKKSSRCACRIGVQPKVV